ncbi:hypothetical protein [Chryseolinea sp. H1M3-3]|uniref:hypothetical protein n=1 Tax=Chryseolinea sp. H1M3-3 TaxID=3034144 RepID=UPI0023EA86E5|nr:hypothetical protein [Chryseolinea sp. H1M3-3]
MNLSLLGRLIIGAIICTSCVAYRLEHRLVEQVNKGRLHEDLTVIALNSPELACPKYSQGRSTECPPGTSLQQSDGYDPSLPDMVLFSMFFLQHQYDAVRDIIETPPFIKALAQVPDPDKEILSWYRDYRSTFHSFFIPSQDSNRLEWTQIQMKLLPVFHNIQSWNFCPSQRNTARGIVHGVYKDDQITLYKTACNAGKIYGSNIKTLARSYRFLFIGAHELGHAIDNEAGLLDNSTGDARLASEKRANLSGLIMAKAMARLLYKRTQMYQNGFLASSHSGRMKYDQAFIHRLESKGAKVERYFDQLLKDAYKDFRAPDKKKMKLNEGWRGNYCLEY